MNAYFSKAAIQLTSELGSWHVFQISQVSLCIWTHLPLEKQPDSVCLIESILWEKRIKTMNLRNAQIKLSWFSFLSKILRTFYMQICFVSNQDMNMFLKTDLLTPFPLHNVSLYWWFMGYTLGFVVLKYCSSSKILSTSDFWNWSILCLISLNTIWLIKEII